jgi:hypothetical protein
MFGGQLLSAPVIFCGETKGKFYSICCLFLKNEELAMLAFIFN